MSINALPSGRNRAIAGCARPLGSTIALTPYATDTKLDKVVPTHEYTIGGPVVKDALWFFNAGRFQKQEQSFQTNVTNVPYVRPNDEKRYEGKLTYTVRPGQVVKGSFTKIQQVITNNGFQNVMDTKSLYNQEQPQDLLSLNYNGVMGTNVYLEGHRLGWPGTGSYLVFYHLNRLEKGDEVILKDREGKAYRYLVSEVMEVNPDDVWVMGQVVGRDMVTLQTCTPIPTFEKRLIVRADRV